MDITALVDSINRLLIGLDNLSVVADGAVAQFDAASGNVTSILETTSTNLTVQMSHLSEVTEGSSANTVTQFSHLVSVLETVFGSLTVQIGALITALAPQTAGAAATSVPGPRALPTEKPLQALPAAPELLTRLAPEKGTPKEAKESEKVSGGFLSIIDSIGRGATALGATAAQAGTRLGGLTAPISVLGGAFSNLAPLAGPLGPAFAVAGETVGKVSQSFERLTGVMSQFAEVASPSIMFEFNRALKDLQATVGQAFTPFFAAMIGITRQVAGELYPAMLALQPTFAAMAEVVGDILVPVANLFGSVLQTMIPVFKFWGDVVKTVAGLLLAAFSPFITLFTSLGAINDL